MCCDFLSCSVICLRIWAYHIVNSSHRRAVSPCSAILPKYHVVRLPARWEGSCKLAQVNNLTRINKILNQKKKKKSLSMNMTSDGL